MSLWRRGTAATLLLALTVFVAVPDAQGQFWVLVNGALNYTGPVTINGGSVLQNMSQSAGTSMTVQNTNSGTGAFAQMSSVALNSSLNVYAFGSGYTTSGRFLQQSGLLDADGTGGLGLAASAAAPITFYTNGSLARWTISSVGTLTGAAGMIASIPVVNATGSSQLNGVLAWSATAPTINSFAGSSPAATVTAGSTTAAFRIGVGGTAPGTTGTLGLPTATTGWNCWFIDQTSPLDITRQTASTTSSVSITSTIAWTANDILVGGCTAF